MPSCEDGAPTGAEDAAALRSDPVRIDRIAVRDRRISCDVALAPDAPRESTPAIAGRLASLFPTLPDHACVNERGDVFGRVIACTPLPHVLEHLVIDLQVRDDERRGAPARTYVGTSEWTDEAAGLARVEVSFTDDLVALRAFRDAVRILCDAVLP